MTGPTLEQQRAQDAWDRCGADCEKEYVNLSKALPALIMNSGLMQVMAFLHEKGAGKRDGPHYKKLAADLRGWLHSQFDDALQADFPGFMEGLLKAEPHIYRAVTAEAFAWLKWLRQMAAARQKRD